MTIFHDMLFRATPGEERLREDLGKATKHAEELEDALTVPDREEFTNPERHVEICFERQRAAHAWRKAQALQSKLNGAENRRYSRGLGFWMILGFSPFVREGITFAHIEHTLKFLSMMAGL